MLRALALLFCLWYCTCSVVLGQSLQIRGRVVDSLNGHPIVNAVVYISTDSAGRILGYGMTDERGAFAITVEDKPAEALLVLHVRSINYRAKRVALRGELDTSLLIILSPSSHRLPDVVVRERAPAMLKRSDTLVYDLDQFRDSTEYNVEDLLRKLPGVEVLSDGRIKVRGKLVDRVLIEGSDLFGGDYTMATKSIRAEYIDRVEVIDHYQENPILRGVYPSESLAINLLMSKRVKNIVVAAGTLGAGVTVTAAPVVQANAQGFWIGRKHKYIALTDNGNAEYHYGIDEIESSTMGLGSGVGGSSTFYPRSFLQFANTENPGLPPEFVDDAMRNFLSLRSETSLSDRWTLRANAAYARKSDMQDAFYAQKYLYDPSRFDLQRYSDLQLRWKYWNADWTLDYSDAGDHAGKVYVRLEGAQKYNREGDVVTTPDRTEEFVSKAGSKRYNWQVRGEYTYRHAKNSVGQLVAAAFDFTNPQQLRAQNTDIPDLFQREPSFALLDQSLQYRHAGGTVAVRHLLRYRGLSYRAEVHTTVDRSFVRNVMYLRDSTGGEVVLFPHGASGDSVASIRGGIRLDVQYRWRAKSKVRLHSQLVRARFYTGKHHMLEGYKTVGGRQSIVAEVALTRRNNLELSYTYEVRVPTVEDFFQTPYFRTAYELYRMMPRLDNQRAHRFGVLYRHTNAFRYRSFTVEMDYAFGAKQWTESQAFRRTLRISEPFYSTLPNALSLSANYNQFWVPLRADVQIQPSFSYERGKYSVDGAVLEVRNAYYSVHTAIRSQVVWGLIVSMEGTLSLWNSASEGGAWLTMVRNALTVVWRRYGWVAFVGIDHRLWRYSSHRSALMGMRSGVRRKFQWRGRELRWSLSVVNLQDTRAYRKAQIGRLYAYAYSVEAVPLYVVWSMDFPFLSTGK